MLERIECVIELVGESEAREGVYWGESLGKGDDVIENENDGDIEEEGEEEEVVVRVIERERDGDGEVEGVRVVVEKGDLVFPKDAVTVKERVGHELKDEVDVVVVDLVEELV